MSSRLALLLPTALVALATVLIATPAATAASSTVLSIQSISFGTSTAPVRVTVRAAPHDTLKAWLNGKRADVAFTKGRPGVRNGDLTVGNGLRYGTNRLRLRTIRPNGASRVLVRTFRVTASVPLADAGRDTSTEAGAPMMLGAAGGGMQGPARPRTVRWRVVSAPKGAKVTLRGTRSERPTVTAKKVGTYVLQMTAKAKGGKAVSNDAVTLYVTPRDTPIGVPFETLSGQADAAIRIDGRPVRDTSDRNGIFVAVLERATRAEKETGTVPRNVDGLNQLLTMTKTYGGKDRYLMIVSGYNGIPSNDLGKANELLKALGGYDLTAENRAALGGGLPFTIAGIPGGNAGGAWTRIPGGYSNPVSGNLTGLIQRNSATQKYDIVSPDQATFETHTAASTATKNQVRVGTTTYDGQLPSGSTAGIHIVSLESLTLRLLSNVTVRTDGPDVPGRLKDLATALRNAADAPGRGLVLVQTIGKVKGAAGEWDRVTEQFLRLGANRALVNGLQGATEYALVARRDADRPPAEASTLQDELTADGPPPPGQLSGLLTRTHTGGYEALTASPHGGSNTDLTAITYQPERPFPAFDTPGKVAAQAYIGAQLGFCDTGAAACDLRREYYEDYRAAWGLKATNLNAMTYPTGTSGFSEGDFAAVKQQLAQEITALVNVKTYFTALQGVFPRAEGTGQIDLQKITKELYDSVQPKGQTESDAYWLGLITNVAEVGSVAFGPVSTMYNGMTSVFGLVSFLTAPNGTPVAGEEIKIRADGLSTKLRETFDQAQEALISQSQLIVSDWGKLQAVAEHVNRDWKLPASDAKAVREMRLATSQWIATELFPAAYRDLIRTTPGLTPRQTSCGFAPFLGHYTQQHPWSDLSLKAQVKINEGVSGTTPYVSSLFAVAGGRQPPSHIADLLFDDPDAHPAGLGLDRLRFFTQANFHGQTLHANDAAPYCDLPFSHNYSVWRG